MQVIRTLSDCHKIEGGCVATLGMFDGVHIGHQAIISQTVRRARERKLPAVVITFANHPRSVLPGREAPKLITTLEHRLFHMSRLGVDFVVVLNFDMELAAISRREFVDRIFRDKLDTRHIVLGFNCKFGKGGRGDIRYLRDLEAGYSFSVETVEPVLQGGMAVSSTSVRNLIEDARLERAAAMLGRPVSLLGTVVHGDGRGKTIGFPTANIDVHNELLPPNSVYICKATVLEGGIDAAGRDDNPKYWSLTNVGTCPTFKNADSSVVETYLFDFDGDLYGKSLLLQFLKKIRDEKKFASREELIAQIQKDADTARSFIAEQEGAS